MDNLSRSSMSDKLRKIPVPPSPQELDKRILDYAKQRAPEPKPSCYSQWWPAVTTASVMIIAVLLVMQPPAPIEQDALPETVITNFPFESADTVQKSQAEPNTLSQPALVDELPASAQVVRQHKQQPRQSSSSISNTTPGKPQPAPELRESQVSESIQKPRRQAKAAPARPVSPRPQATASDQLEAVALDTASPPAPLRKHSSATVDTDTDGLPDNWEKRYRLDIIDASDAKEDSDNDGLTNEEEYRLKTNPRVADTDNDLIPDGWENEHGLDPLKPDASADTDNDGQSNLQEYYRSQRK